MTVPLRKQGPPQRDLSALGRSLMTRTAGPADARR